MCGTHNRWAVFPALLASRQAALPEAALEGEAACYEHPAKRAVAACQQCGRFVCRLCSVDFGVEVWCPPCIATGAGKVLSAKRDNSRTLYDSIALLTPLTAFIVWPFTLIAAPISLVLSIVKWRAPLSLVRRNRWRFVAAILISLLQLAGWGFGIIYITIRAARPS